MSTMKAVKYSEFGDPAQVLTFVEVPIPETSPGAVRIKVKAASVNPVDQMIVGGVLKDMWPCELPAVPGYDVSGVVDAVGDNVEGFAVGDEVYGVNWALDKGQPYGPHHADDFNIVAGAFAEYAVVPAVKLCKKPASLSHAEAAATSLVATTAFQSLDVCQVKEGSKVLILGGAGAVGHFAVQMAKSRGAWVATTCSPRTKEYVTSAVQPDLVIDYTTTKWEELSELKGIDAVFDAIGEKDGWAKTKDNGIVKEGGVFLSIANPDVGFQPDAHPGYTWASYFILKANVQTLSGIGEKVAEGKLKVQVHKFPFSEAGVKDIFAAQQSGKSMGKNVLIMDE